MGDEATPATDPAVEGWLTTASGKARFFAQGRPQYPDDYESATDRFRAAGVVKRAVGRNFIYRYAIKAGCPKRIVERHIDTSIHEALVRKFAETMDTGGSMLLCGATGVGKTVIGVRCILGYALSGDFWLPKPSSPYEQGYYSVPKATFTTAQRLYSAVFQRREQQLDHARRAGILVVDDWGAQYEHEWPLSELDALVDWRYAQLRPTVVTTNLHPTRESGGDDSFEALYPRAFSRLADRSGPGVHVLRGPDLRQRER